MKPVVVGYRSQEPAARDAAQRMCPELTQFYPDDIHLGIIRGALYGAPLILLGIGEDGRAAVARRVEADGLDGVAAIVLVAPSAPWASRVRPKWAPCGLLDHDGSCGCDGYVPLGPLEPLRAVAERARLGVCDSCQFVYGPGHIEAPCKHTARLVVTAHPELVKCEACGGIGQLRRRGDFVEWRPCAACSGTGRALGPADVAREMCGLTLADLTAVPATDGEALVHVAGGISILQWRTRADHDREAIGAALRLALEGT